MLKKLLIKKQDELIEQLQDNQDNIIQAIQHDPTKAIAYDGKILPQIDWYKGFEDGDEGDSDEGDSDEGDSDEGDGDGDDDKPSTSKKKIGLFNLDNGMSKDFKDLLKANDYELPSKLFKEKQDVSETIKRVNGKIKRTEDYIKKHSTKEGKMRVKLKSIQKTTYARNENELPFYKDYLKRLEHIKAAPKYMKGTGYTQPKRNAYKISSGGQYGNLIIDVPKLMGQLH